MMESDTGNATMGRSGDYILRCYLEDIRKAGQVNRGDESALFRMARQGDERARDMLIAANMRFVVKVALEYRACPMPIPDLISEGAIGLIHSVETFDPDRGIRFISFAVWWIRSHITKALSEKGYLIRLPANQYFRLRKAMRAERTGNDPEPEEIRKLKQMSQGCASLDSMMAGTKKSWGEMIADVAARDPSREAERNLGTNLTERILDRLPHRERIVLRGCYGIGDENPLTLKEVGGKIGLSSERVRQIRRKTIEKLSVDPDAAQLRDRYECLMGLRPD